MWSRIFYLSAPIFHLAPRKEKTTFCVKQNWTLTIPQFLLDEGRVKKKRCECLSFVIYWRRHGNLACDRLFHTLYYYYYYYYKTFLWSMICPPFVLPFFCVCNKVKGQDWKSILWWRIFYSLFTPNPTHTHPAPSSSSTRANGESNEDWARPSARSRCLLSSVQTRTNKSRDLLLYTIKKYNVGQLSGPRSYIVSHFCLVPARIFRDIFRVRGDFGQCFRFFLYSIFRVSILNILSPNVICLCLLYVSCVHGFGI